MILKVTYRKKIYEKEFASISFVVMVNLRKRKLGGLVKKLKLTNIVISGVLALSVALGMVPMVNTVAYAATEEKLVAFGDSIPAGDALANPTTENFVALIDAREDIVAVNKGVSGQTSLELKNEITAGTHNAEITGANHITITIGGNDLMATLYALVADQYNEGKAEAEQISPEDVPVKMAAGDLGVMLTVLAIVNAGYVGDTAAAFKATSDSVCSNIQAIITHIKTINPDAKIYVTNQYNPYKDIVVMGANVGAFFDTGLKTDFNPSLAKLSESTGCTVVDIHTPFNNSTEKVTNAVVDASGNNFDFHPNAAGHRLYAATLNPFITVTPKSTETDIEEFTVSQQVGSSVIDVDGHTVALTVPYGTSVTSLVPTIVLSSGASVVPGSGSAQNFTNTVDYTVTAEDGVTTQVWKVTVTAEAPPEKVANPSFTPDGGNFETTQSVQIASSTTDADIYYTTNGTDPSPTNGTLYNKPFDVTESTTLKAIAVKADMTNSDVVTAVFTKTAPITTCVITFDANGGSGSQNPETATKGVSFDLPTTTTFTAPDGKQFKGWSLTNDGQIITSHAFVTDTTVYAVWEKKPPTIVDGANLTVVQGEKAEFKSDAEFSDYLNTGVTVNGVSQTVHTVGNDSSKASAIGGSTILTLSGEYTKSLPLGTHTISINSTNGSATTQFTVIAKEQSAVSQKTLPKTGDENTVLPYVIGALVSLGGIGCVVLRKKIQGR